MLELLGKKQARYLGQGFDYQHSRHDRGPGKMPLEKLLVKSNVLYSLYSPVTFYLHYLIHQQKRVPVRKYPLYPADVQQGFGAELRSSLVPFGQTGKPPGKLLIQGMAAFICHNTAHYRFCRQHQVPY